MTGNHMQPILPVRCKPQFNCSIRNVWSKWPNTVLVHTPVHASWLNQIEIYFSVVQRKALTPNDFSSLTEAKERLLGFQSYYQRIAKPFEWTFTRKDLQALLARMNPEELAKAA
jgi:hypothetical protein